jgi:transposase
MRKERPRMPAAAARQLREALPPRNRRWRSSGATTFLKILADTHDQYGVKECASALGVVESTIYDWLNRSAPRSGEEWPSQRELRELRRAWRVKQARRKNGRYITRSSIEFEDVYWALKELLTSYDIRVIAAALGESTRELRTFTRTPQESYEERVELGILVSRFMQEMTRQKRLSGRTDVNALRQALAPHIKIANHHVSAGKIAERLGRHGLSLADVQAALRHEESG